MCGQRDEAQSSDLAYLRKPTPGLVTLSAPASNSPSRPAGCNTSATPAHVRGFGKEPSFSFHPTHIDRTLPRPPFLPPSLHGTHPRGLRRIGWPAHRHSVWPTMAAPQVATRRPTPRCGECTWGPAAKGAGTTRRRRRPRFTLPRDTVGRSCQPPTISLSRSTPLDVDPASLTPSSLGLAFGMPT
jgi:hypothetical protein